MSVLNANNSEIILFIFVFLFNNCNINAEIVVSYNKTIDHVEILTGETFDDFVYNSKTATIVEFFAHWCGRCKRWAVRNYHNF